MAQQNNNSVDLIDPIDSVSKLGNKYLGIPNYEEMFIFVSLKAKRKTRSVINNNGAEVTNTNNFNDIEIDLLGFDQETNRYTTNWTDSFDSTKTIYEGFGISKIDIKTNSSYIPRVNIEFRDIRGSAFYNLGEKSPYSVLLDFPPPIFELTVKGYYGRALKYQLHLLKHTTDFDSERGDFLINAEFVARTFAPLTDIPFKYIDMFPLMERNTSAIIDSETQKQLTGVDSVNSSDQNISSFIRPRNTHELISKLESLYNDLSDLENNSEEASRLENIQKLINDGERIINKINVFKNFFSNDKYSNNAKIIIKQDVDNDGDSGGIIREILNVNGFNSIIETTNDDGQKLSLDMKLFLGIKMNNISDSTPNNFISADGNKTTTNAEKNLNELKKSLISDAVEFIDVIDNDIKLAEPIYGNFVAVNNIEYYGIDITQYYMKVKKYLDEKQIEYDNISDILAGKANQAAIKNIGMLPTIRNVFEIICDDVDMFFNKLRTTTIEAEKHHIENSGLILDSIEETKINAFPLYVKSTKINNVERKNRAVPVDLSNKVRNAGGKPFPEINLINEFIETFITQKKDELIKELRVQKDNNGNNKWIPITPVDSILFNRDKESPYKNIEFQYQDKLNQNINKVFNKIIERFYVASQYTWGIQFYDSINNYATFTNAEELSIDKIIKYAAGAEAVNLVESLTDANTIAVLKNKANSFKNNKNIPLLFKEWEENIPSYNKIDIYSSTNTSNYGVLGNTSQKLTSSSEVDTVGGNVTFENLNKVYKNRANESFFGVKILNNNDLPSKRTNGMSDTDSPVDKFMNSRNLDFFDTISDWFKGGDSTPKEFTKENILFVDDVNSVNVINGDYSTKYINGYDNYFFNTVKFSNEPYTIITDLPTTSMYKYKFSNSLSDVISHELSIDNFSNELYNVLTGNTDIEIKEFLLVSNFLKSRSYFHNTSRGLYDVNDGFLYPCVNLVPYFSVLYMGGLVRYSESSEFKNTFDGIVTGFTKNMLYDLSALKVDAFYVEKLLSNRDKDEFKLQFNKFREQGKLANLLNAYKNFLKINIENYQGDSLELKYKNLLEKEYKNSILDVLFEKNAVIVANQFAFSIPKQISGDSFIFPSIETDAFQPLSVTNTDSRINKNIIYFTEFFNVLLKNIEDKENEINNIENVINDNISDDDIKTRLYYSFKNISDKWIAGGKTNNIGFPLNQNIGDRLINKFKFVDRAMNDIGDSCIINVEPLISMSKDYDISVFSVMSQLLSNNGFEFFPLQNFMSFENKKWDEAFQIIETDDQTSTPAFVCMYIGGTSNHLYNNSSEFDDDGIIDLVGESLPDFKTTNNTDPTISQVKAFKVRFAEQNQSFFNNIKIEGKDFKETNDSLAILSKIANDDSKTSPIPKAQNLYTIYEGRSYSSTVTMLGNMMIQPTQYFQLENIPLYSGAYMVLDVEHSFTPNHAITKFQGVRLAKYPNPIVTEFATTTGFQVGNSKKYKSLNDLKTNPLFDRVSGFKNAMERAVVEDTFSIKNNDIISKLHPKVQDDFKKLINAWYAAGFPMQINSGYRSFDKQTELKSNEFNNLNPVADAGNSFHNYGLAIDVSLLKTDTYGNITGDIYTQDVNPFWLEIGEIAERLGFRWGGRFNSFDPVHFEKTNGYGYFNNDFSSNPIYDGSTPQYDTVGTIIDLKEKYNNGNFVTNSNGKYVAL